MLQMQVILFILILVLGADREPKGKETGGGLPENYREWSTKSRIHVSKGGSNSTPLMPEPGSHLKFIQNEFLLHGAVCRAFMSPLS